jgi:hypothetical protein
MPAPRTAERSATGVERGGLAEPVLRAHGPRDEARCKQQNEQANNGPAPDLSLLPLSALRQRDFCPISDGPLSGFRQVRHGPPEA